MFSRHTVRKQADTKCTDEQKKRRKNNYSAINCYSQCGTSRYVTSHPGQLCLAIPSWLGANEYQPEGGDAMRLGSKVRYGECAGGRRNCVIPLLHTGHI